MSQLGGQKIRSCQKSPHMILMYSCGHPVHRRGPALARKTPKKDNEFKDPLLSTGSGTGLHVCSMPNPVLHMVVSLKTLCFQLALVQVSMLVIRQTLFPKTGGPQYRPPKAVVLILFWGPLERYPQFLGNPKPYREAPVSKTMPDYIMQKPP